MSQVATTGQRRIRIRRLAILATAAAVAATAGVGFGIGRSDGIDLVGESTTVAARGGATAPYSVCPGEAPLDDLHQGDRVYLTGRSDDGSWLELRSPASSEERVWVPAAVVGADAGTDDLPVHDCRTAGDQLALPGQTTTTLPPTTQPGDTTTTATTQPGDTTTTTVGSPTTVPSTSTTKPPTTTTTSPDTTPPAISNLVADNNTIYTDDGVCGPTSHSTPVSATVTDDRGISSVRLEWSFPGQSGTVAGSTAMTLSGGKYRGRFGPFPYGTLPGDGSVDVTWRVSAVDTSGNPRVVSVLKSERVRVYDTCFG